VLWRKLPARARPPGAIVWRCGLVCDRELEARKSARAETGPLWRTLATPRGDAFEALLFGADGQRSSAFDIGAGKKPSFSKRLEKPPSGRAGRNRSVPRATPTRLFTTRSTFMPAEPSRKLRLSRPPYDRLAQRLSEAARSTARPSGLITLYAHYMALPDGVDLAAEA